MGGAVARAGGRSMPRSRVRGRAHRCGVVERGPRGNTPAVAAAAPPRLRGALPPRGPEPGSGSDPGDEGVD